MSSERRYFVIGDVHGCTEQTRALLKLLESRCEPEGPKREFLFVGDLVDRGPDAKGAVDLVIRGTQERIFRCILGNHDEMFLQNLLLFRPDLVAGAGVDLERQEPLVASYRFAKDFILDHWLSQGGDATIRSYRGVPEDPETWEIPAEHIHFIANLPLAIRVDDLVITHAWADAEAAEAALKHQEDPWSIPPDTREVILWNRDQPSKPVPGLHISGHTARTAPLVRNGAIGIDTGCCFGNRLTAYDYREDRFIHVSCEDITPFSG